MLKLRLGDLNYGKKWESLGISVPSYNIGKMRQRTKEEPRWVHVGAGNIFRAFIADLAQELLDSGDMETGITVISNFDQQIISRIYEPYDSLALKVVMRPDGALEKKVIGSIGEVLRADSAYPVEWERAKEVFSSPSLQMVSFTITEKGYAVKNMAGEFYPPVLDDFASGAYGSAPKSGIGIIAALLLERFRNGAYPIAMVSMDNFSHNGDRLFSSISTFAEKWVENGSAPKGFLEYVRDPLRVSFPWSMIDKITPRPDKRVANDLMEHGFESTNIVITDKNTYIAPFVNTEGPQYLVIEDTFPNGRPPLEKTSGVSMATREIVDSVERMKVCTCLNPLHTAMAIFGCLLGFSSIAEEMKDAAIVKLIKRIGYVEGMPVVTDPKIFSPRDFIKEVVEERLPNPYIPDTPQRIATDTSQKLAIRFGETIKHYLERSDLDIASLKAIPLVLAAWCRYLMGVADDGTELRLSPDPMAEGLRGGLAALSLGDLDGVEDALRPILSSERIFGVDLYKVGLAGTVIDQFNKLAAAPGAVRRTLEETVSDWQ